MIDSLPEYLRDAAIGVWKWLPAILKFLLEVVALILAVAFAHIEHEAIQSWVKNVKRSWLGRWIAPIGFVWRRWVVSLGWHEGAVTREAHWAGAYKLTGAEGTLDVQRAIERDVTVCHADCSQGHHAHYWYLPGAGIREVVTVLRNRLAPDWNVLFFDCSSVLLADLPGRFLNNVAAWSPSLTHFSPDPLPIDSIELVESLKLNDLRASLKGISRTGRTAVILCDVHRLMDPAPPELTERESEQWRHAKAIVKLLFDQTRIPLVTTWESDGGQPPRLMELVRRRILSRAVFALWRRRRNRVTKLRPYEGVHHGVLRRVVASEVVDPASVDRVLLDHLLILMGLKVLDPTGGGRIEEDFQRAAGPSRTGMLVSAALKTLSANSVVTSQFHDPETQLRKLVVATCQVDAPMPLATLHQLWTGVGVPVRSQADHDVEGYLEDGLTNILVQSGLLQRLWPTGILSSPLYAVRRSVAVHLRNAEGSSESREVADKVCRDYQPPGTTHLSSYLSQGDFRPAVDLLLQESSTSNGWSVPLPPALGQIVSAYETRSGGLHVQLRSYEWKDRSGRDFRDVVAALAPVEICDAYRLARVRVHIVSREGVGRAVRAALQPYVDSFLDAEGDAYRCGPGGYLELLVSLKPLEELLESTEITSPVKEEIRRHGSDAEQLALVLKAAVTRVLRASVDETARVVILMCTPWKVSQEWSAKAMPISGRVELRRIPPSVYGASSRYEIWLDGDAVRAAKAELSCVGDDSILLRCIYSPRSLQVFAVLTRLRLDGQIRAEVAGESSAREHITLTFMENASRHGFNLLSLRHGQHGSYAAELAVPIAPDTESQEGRLISRIQRLSESMTQSRSRLRVLNGLLIKDESVRGDAAAGRRFGTGPHVREVFDLVADADAFHRFMRKHLFIPDSDAAAVALVQREISRRGKCHILEIGAGTGALTEKLALAGIANRPDTYLDSVEPDKGLVPILRGIYQRYSINGRVYPCKLEDFQSEGVKYDILVSQGVHHHVPTTESATGSSDYRLEFLRLCRSLLRDDGVYVLSDEFLRDYESDAERRAVLDRWYTQVISTALADGLQELADLEYGFWLSDRSGTAEMKESMSAFEARLKGPESPFVVASASRFGFEPRYHGGFAVFVLEANHVKWAAHQQA